MRMIELELIQTLAAGGLALFAGFGLLRLFPLLKRYNIPAAVVGGLLVASLITLSRVSGFGAVTFDTSLQAPLMTAFFTSIGFSASLSLLRVGSRQALLFLLLASVLAVTQNFIGMGVAVAFGESPLLGVLMGSPAPTGGPATALAFAPLFSAAGVPAAESLAIAAAMAGIVLGGLAGGPIATRLLERHGLVAGTSVVTVATQGATSDTSRVAEPAASAASADKDNDEDGVRETLKG